MNEVKIQWHSGFVAAMDLELSVNRKDLIYEREYNLNTKPLEIDLLVIKKDKDVQIENEIGKIFRGHNLWEYKSPGDHLNVDTFYKSGAYASLYKSYGATVDERRADDITVSIVREEKPEGLFRYFAERGIKVEKQYPGIYRVVNEVLFPTQIVVTEELDEESHTWLKALSDKLRKEQMRTLLERTDGLTQKLERELADAVLEVSIRANKEIVEELRGDERMCQALLEIMEPEINKITERVRKETEEKVRKETEEKVRKETEEKVRKETEEKVRKETEEKVRKEIEERDRIHDMGMAKKMIATGKFSVEKVKEFVPRLSIDEIRNLEKELGHF